MIRSSLASSKTKVRKLRAEIIYSFFQSEVEIFNWHGPTPRSVAVQQMSAVWHEQGMKDVAQRRRENGVRFFNGSAGVVQALTAGHLGRRFIEPPFFNALSDGAPVWMISPPPPSR